MIAAKDKCCVESDIVFVEFLDCFCDPTARYIVLLVHLHQVLLVQRFEAYQQALASAPMHQVE